MSIILVAVLIIGGLAGAAAVVIGIPAVIGLMAFDLAESRKKLAAEGQVAPAGISLERISLERGVARAFVIGGGAFWSVAIFAGMFVFGQSGVAYAMLGAFFPLVAVTATLVVGWYFERAAAALLVLGSIAVVAWGVIYQFEVGVWALMVVALIGPMMTAAVLFWMARRDEDAFETALAASGELVPVPVASTRAVY